MASGGGRVARSLVAETIAQEEPLLRASSRAPPSRGGERGWRLLGLGVALAVAACAAVAGVSSMRGGAGVSSRAVSDDGHFLAEKTVVSGGSIEATAEELTRAADAANAKLQADRQEVERLEAEAKDKSDEGRMQVDNGTKDVEAAKDAQAKAEAMQKEAAEQIKKAQDMLAEAQKKEQVANALQNKGNQAIVDAKGLQTQANTIESGEPAESVGATAAIRAELPALEEEAKYLSEQANSKKNATEAAFKVAKEKLDAASAAVDKIEAKIQAATNQSKADADEVAKGNDVIRKSNAALDESKQTVIQGTADEKKGRKDLADAKHAAGDAKAQQGDVDKEADKVASLEKAAWAKSKAHRVCVDVPGVRLREAAAAAGFDPVTVEKDVSSPEKCMEWCLQHEGCAQMIYSAGNKGCYLFEKATKEISEWTDVYTSAICGDKSHEKAIKDMADEIKAAKPEVPGLVKCSWQGEDCAATKCCNDVFCAWGTKDCKGHSCYQNAGSSTCQQTAAWTQGQIIGGFREVRKVPSAADTTTKQGTSLFCFMAVNWKSDEQAVANFAKDKKFGIFECDANTILTGWEVPKTPWATWMNADAFVKLWQQVKDHGEYAKHDWTVKVDADTVFFPNMLRMHLDSLKVPQGSRAYVRNVKFGFEFQGALEVFTRQAVQLYFDQGGVCDKILKANQKNGEDFIMKTCMDALGVDFVEDFAILRDQKCGADCGAPDASCGDGWVAAYHSFRNAGSWGKCHDEARAAQLKAGHKPEDGGLVAERPAPKAEDLPDVDGPDATAAHSLLKQATDLNNRLEPDAKAANAAVKAAAKHIKVAEGEIHDAKAAIAGAKKNASDARDAAADAKKDIAEAEAAKAKVDKTLAADTAKKQELSKKEASAQSAYDAAKTAVDDVAEKLKRATDAETKERDDIASIRLCMDLPGVRIKGGTPMNITSIVMPVDTQTAESCSMWCRQHNKCLSAVFSEGNKGCYMFSERAEEAQEFAKGYNSTYCGTLEERDALQAIVDKIYKTMPYVPPVPECAWAGENCMQSKCCANVPVPNWKFTEFQWYTCYKKDENFASCQTGPAPGGWDGTVLGHMGTREVPKAPEGVLTQGTSLFCFCVVVWSRPATAAFWSSEAELANNIKTTGRSIMKCDDHEFFEGSGLNNGGDASSINNIDSFIGAWKKVHDDGRYLQHDWTVKVDSDAVFFPDRLKMHIQSLRTPQGSRVYLRNINFKFEFLGALEVFTKEALQLYFEKSWMCDSKVGHQGGEDYYMLACLDGIGVDHQTDHQLLNDKYAATGNCNDPWVVGFHFYKKVSSWNACHDAAVNVAKNQGKDWWQWE